MTISIGESMIQIQRISVKKLEKRGIPTRANICQANSLTRSTSVVIRVIICALLEKSLSPSSAFFAGCSSAFSFSGTVVCRGIVSVAFPAGPVSSESDFGAAEEATSFRTSVFAKRTELSWILNRTWTAVVASDHNWPLTFQGNQQRSAHSADGTHTDMTESIQTEQSQNKDPSPAPVFSVWIILQISHQHLEK
jgi:hypothetical protein